MEKSQLNWRRRKAQLVKPRGAENCHCARQAATQEATRWARGRVGKTGGGVMFNAWNCGMMCC
jgi:hypothetical protein